MRAWEGSSPCDGLTAAFMVEWAGLARLSASCRASSMRVGRCVCLTPLTAARSRPRSLVYGWRMLARELNYAPSDPLDVGGKPKKRK